MKLKSYFAKDVKTALDKARLELGPDAMLIQSRKATPETRHLGEYEVVMTAETPEVGGQAPMAYTAPTAQQDYSRLSAEMSEMRKQIERMAAAVNRSSVLHSARNIADQELAAIFNLMESGDVNIELAEDILRKVRPDGKAMVAAVAETASRFSCNPQLGRDARSPKIVAMIGPCGSGKTTTLVKLAVRYGLTARRPTQLISMDTSRIAGADQLRSYASILGVGFQALETPVALAQAIEEHRNKELILIDTAGHGPHDMDSALDLARFLASRRDIESHLVLTASMRSADLSRVVDRFEIFRPQKLLFTKLDETEVFGPILNEAARTGKPVSFLTAGQQIPEDLEPATKERILNLVFERGTRREKAAALAA